MKCPCCGSEIPDIPVEALAELRLSPQERKILDILIAHYPRRVKRERVVNLIWADDPNGGPDNPDNGVSVLMSRIRVKLRGTGWHVPKNRGGDSYGWVLLVKEKKNGTK